MQMRVQNHKKQKRNKYLRYAGAAGIGGAAAVGYPTVNLGSNLMFGKDLNKTLRTIKGNTSTNLSNLQKAAKSLYPNMPNLSFVNSLTKVPGMAGAAPYMPPSPGIAPGVKPDLTIGDLFKKSFKPDRFYVVLPGGRMKNGAVDYRPGSVAHEMGHSMLYNKAPRAIALANLSKTILQMPIARGINPIRMIGALGAVATGATRSEKHTSARTKRLITGALIATPFMLMAPTLTDEALASFRAMRILKKAGYSRKVRKGEAKLLRRSYGTYLTDPVISALPAAAVALAMPVRKKQKQK